MDTKAALGAAGGIALTVAGGVSALLLTIGSPSASPEVETNGDAVVTQYVDEFGNPVDAPLVAEAATTPEVVVIGPDGQPVDARPQTDTSASDAEPEEDEYPEGGASEMTSDEPEEPEGDESEEYEDDDDEEDEDDD